MNVGFLGFLSDDYFKTAPLTMATMVSNHDLFAGERLWDQVGANLAQYKLAAATYLLQPGTPFIYYGEEVGMSAGLGLSGDAKLRIPMSWNADTRTAGFSGATPFRAVAANVASQNVAAELADPTSLLSFYKAMLGLRNTYGSIARGTYESAFVSGLAMGFQRSLGTEKTWVLINYGDTGADVNLVGLPPLATLNPLYPVGSAAVHADSAGRLVMPLSAQSVRVLLLGNSQ